METKIVKFLLANHWECRLWLIDLAKWVNWYMTLNCCAIVMDGENITGIGLARLVRLADDGIIPYEFDPMGSCVFVDLAVSTNHDAKRSLFKALIKNLGIPDTIAFRRNGFDEIKEYDFGMFWQKFLTIQSYGRHSLPPSST